MSSAIASHVAALDVNTGLFFNALRDIDDAQAARRFGPGVNSAAFIAAHLVDARHLILKQLGLSHPNPLDALGSIHKEDDLKTLPQLGQLRAAWLDVARVLRAALLALTPEQLASSEPSHPFPIAQPGPFGAVVFLLHHESYHIGQLGLLRRQLGHPAMAYSPAPEVNA